MSGSGLVREGGDRQAHRAGAGVGHEVEPAPAAQRVEEEHVELIGRLVDDDLADPRGDHEQGLERHDRQGLDHERATS